MNTVSGSGFNAFNAIKWLDTSTKPLKDKLQEATLHFAVTKKLDPTICLVSPNECAGIDLTELGKTVGIRVVSYQRALPGTYFIGIEYPGTKPS